MGKTVSHMQGLGLFMRLNGDLLVNAAVLLAALYAGAFVALTWL